MGENTITKSRLTQLAKLRSDKDSVLSVFFNLDPTLFSTPAARSSELTSVITQAMHKVDSTNGLDRQSVLSLKSDLARVREVLTRSDLANNGTHGVAVYASTPLDLFEVIRLAEPIDSGVIVADRAFLKPIAFLGSHDRWFVVLVNSRSARIFSGDRPQLTEIEQIEDEVHRKHEQGGWSQANYQRSVDKEKLDHLVHVTEVLFEHYKRFPFENLIMGAPSELATEFEQNLHPYLRNRLAGRIHLDVENSSLDEVRSAASILLENQEKTAEETAMSQLVEAVNTGGRGAAGLVDVLTTLNEARVDSLLIGQGFTAGGRMDAETGFLAPFGGEELSPAGNPLTDCDNIVERAVERALEQSADVMVVRFLTEEIDQLGGIGALLRF